MSDLLQIGKSGVLAYQGALATIGENVTNADTEGFARRQVVLKEQTAAAGPFTTYRTSSAFGGVQADNVQRVWDQYKAADAWTANSDSSYASTRSQYLTTVQDQLNDSDTGVGTQLTAVFTAASQLAANPTDTTLRQTMIAAVGDAASALGQTGANLAKVATTVSTQATTLVSQTNDALTALAKINLALHSSPQGSAGRAQLEDQRDQLIGTISGNLGVDVTLDTDGAVSLKLNDYAGPQLLSSTDSVPAYVTMQTASDGRLAMTLTAKGQVSAATPTSGTLAGLVDSAATIAGRRQQLDGLAGNFVTALNTWQGQGLDASGNPGVPLLTGTDAASIALATSDPNAIAAASADGTANGNLLAITQLRGSGGVEAGWRAMVTDQSLQVASANTAATAASTQKDSAYTALDQVSGIDLDNEAAELLRYQQAYTASAKIIQTAKDTLQAVLNLF